MKRISALLVLLALVAGFVAAQDLTIDYRFNVRSNDRDNYFTFTGPIRYMAADRDQLDATTGASAKGSTELFQPYLLDVKGKNAMSSGLRGLFLFAVAGTDQREIDNLQVSKANNGVITIQYVHRGTAYRIITDNQGRLAFPDGQFQRRKVGFIVGAGPQVISRDFASNGTAARIDYNKVWDANVRGGTVIDASRSDTTSDITSDGAVPESMFYWSGTLQVGFDRNILTIAGGLNAVKR